MIIIDFNGLPGCGKSTYASELYKKITEEGYSCELLNKNEYIQQQCKSNKIKNYMRLFVLPNFVYCIKMLLKWRKTKFNREISIKDKIWKTLRIVILDDRIHRVSKKENGVVIIDQGIIQDYADFFVDKELDENDLKEYTKKYKDILDKILFVNCEITIDETIKRIKSRERKKYDVDLMKENELRKYLELQNQNLEELRDTFKNQKFTAINIEAGNDSTFTSNINQILQNIEKRR